jgi:hypothetical protein
VQNFDELGWLKLVMNELATNQISSMFPIVWNPNTPKINKMNNNNNLCHALKFKRNEVKIEHSTRIQEGTKLY